MQSVIHRQRRISSAVAAALLAAGLVGITSKTASAQSFSWNGATGNWSDPTQWQGGVSPTGIGLSDTLVFGDPAPYTSTADVRFDSLSRAFVKQIDIQNTADGAALNSATFATGGQNFFTFASPGAAINKSGAGSAGISGPILISQGTTLNVTMAPGSGTLSLGAGGTPNDLWGPGNLVITNNSSNYVLFGNAGVLFGDVTVAAGYVQAPSSGSAGDLFGEATVLHIGSGATFDFNGNAEQFGGFDGGGTLALGATGGLRQDVARDLVWNGTITQVAGSTAGYEKHFLSGKTSMTWTNVNNYAGNTLIDAGTFTLTGNGAVPNTRQFSVTNGAVAILDNTAVNNNDRIKDGGTLAIGGQLVVLGGTGVATSENVGTATIDGTGVGEFRVVNGPSGGTAQLNLLGINKNGIARYFNVTGSGSVTVGTVTIGANTGLINGIIPFGTIDNEWATLGGTSGNQIVPLSTYQTSTDPTTWAATDNVKLSAAPSVALAGDGTINSLHFASSQTLDLGSHTLTLANGGVLAASEGTISNGNLTAAQSVANQREVLAVVNGTNKLTVSANILNNAAGTIGLTKAGSGTLALTGNNDFSNGVRLWGGTIELNAAQNLGNSLAIVANNGAFKFNNSMSLVPATGTRTLVTNRGGVTFDTGANTVTLGATDGTAATGVAISGNGDVTKLGSGTLQINGSNTFAGDFLIKEGTVEVIGTAGSFVADDSIVDLAAGTTFLQRNNSEQFGGLRGSGTYNTGDSFSPEVAFVGDEDTTFSGIITGAGKLRVTGRMTATLTGMSNFLGGTRIDTGTIVINHDVRFLQDGPLGNSTENILLGAATGTVTISQGDAALLIGAPGVTVDRGITTQAFTTANGTITSGIGQLIIGSNHNSGTSQFVGSLTLNRSITYQVAAGGTTDFLGEIFDAQPGVGILKTGGGVANVKGFNPGLSSQGKNIERLGIADGTLRVIPNGTASGTTIVKSLTVGGAAGAWSATFDATDNFVIVDYEAGSSPLATVKSQLTSGYNGGAWTGKGITSSTAAAAASSGHKTALGYGEAAAVLGSSGGTFGGQTVDADAILIRYTYTGDANLDGTVDTLDFNALAGNFGGTGKVWTQADFNFDGVVDTLDFNNLAANFGQHLSEAGGAGVGSLVPEPGGIVIGAIGLVGLGRRCRRKVQHSRLK